MRHAQHDEQHAYQEWGGVAEVAGAGPGGVGHERDRKCEHEGGTGVSNLDGDLFVDSGDGESAPGCSPENGVAHAFGEFVRMEEVRREEQDESHHTGCDPDHQSRLSSHWSYVEQERERHRDQDDQGELRSYSDGQ